MASMFEIDSNMEVKYKHGHAYGRALRDFINNEFGGNLRDGQHPTRQEAEQLARDYPDIWEQYKPEIKEVNFHEQIF
jgi:hypothetical protein